jgi:hypothetical protein
MQQDRLPLLRHQTRRPIRIHKGTVIALASNPRQPFSGLEVPRWPVSSGSSWLCGRSHPVQWLADNGWACAAHDIRDFAVAMNLVVGFTPFRQF